jgi:predicted N-acetyltransferase YhbS
VSTYRIRLAVDSDLDAVIGLRTEAEQWLRERGIAQWTSEFYAHSRGLLSESVAAGAAWVVEDGGRVVATVTLNGPDMDFWTEADDLDSAQYLGKLIVARSHANRDLGDAIMNWASVRAEQDGKTWLRLDCRRDNTGLHRYYQLRGWIHVRTVAVEGRFSGALFQRPAGLIAFSRSTVVGP